MKTKTSYQIQVKQISGNNAGKLYSIVVSELENIPACYELICILREIN